MTKYCIKCKEWKTLMHFHRAYSEEGTYFPICKDCRRNEYKESRDFKVLRDEGQYLIPNIKNPTYVERLALEVAKNNKSLATLREELTYAIHGHSVLSNVQALLVLWKKSQ